MVNVDAEVLARVVGAAKIGLVLIDKHKDVLLWNDWMAETSGITGAEAQGKSLPALFGQVPERLDAALDAALNYGMASILSHAINGSPLPLYPEGQRDKPPLHQQIELRSLRLPDGSRGCLIQIQDVSSDVQRADLLQERNRQLSRFSYIDTLTNLPNRRRFDEHLDAIFRMARRNQRAVSIAMIDVDCFKQFNDSLGHLEGDQCLQFIASHLRSVLTRGGDLMARYGGEEFSAVMAETSLDGAARIANEIRANIENACYQHPNSVVGPYVTVSIGVATLIPQPGEVQEDLIKLADQALYEAKRSGRNRVFGVRRHSAPMPLDEPAVVRPA